MKATDFHFQFVGTVTKWTYEQWEEKIAQNFEKFFWVPEAPCPGEERPDLVNRRGIYKDSHGASQPWADFQLRCNFPIALIVVRFWFSSVQLYSNLFVSRMIIKYVF